LNAARAKKPGKKNKEAGKEKQVTQSAANSHANPPIWNWIQKSTQKKSKKQLYFQMITQLFTP